MWKPLLVVASLFPLSGAAQTCADLAARAGAAAGLPDDLLPGIAVVESGRGAGWPWTLNVEGRGFHFDTRDEALAHLRQELDAGKRSIDIGCMQINYRWHGENFASVEEMIDPEANTAYAARFLIDLKDRYGSWEAATRRYHSPDPDRGARYVLAVEAAVERGPGDSAAPVSAPAGIARDDRFAAAAPLVDLDRALERAVARGAVLPAQSLPVIPVAARRQQGAPAPVTLRTRLPAYDGQRLRQLRAALAPQARGGHP